MTKILYTLMAGAKATVSCGMDAEEKVYVLDANGNPIQEAPKDLADEVRTTIKRGIKGRPIQDPCAGGHALSLHEAQDRDKRTARSDFPGKAHYDITTDTSRLAGQTLACTMCDCIEFKAA